MCGIAGVISLDNEPLLPGSTDSFLTKLNRRGPDALAQWSTPAVWLGQGRLAIRGGSAGKLPLAKAGLVLVYNGEIYNNSEVSTALRQHGSGITPPEASADSAVLFAAIRAWGPACLPQLNGMFAWAAWDQEKQSLLIARDRLGKKPFYYYRDAKRFVFASELGPLAAFLSHARSLEIDPTALCDLMALGYIPGPKTIYKDIYSLPPATSATLDVRAGTFATQPYWSLAAHFTRTTWSGERAEDVVDEFRTRLRTSIHMRLTADRPLAVLASGGVDSTAIMAYAARLAQRPSHAYSASFSNSPCDETAKFLRAAAYTGFKAATFEAKPPSFRDLVTMMDSLGQPFFDSSTPVYFQLMRLIQPHATVLLSGDGADEQLGGYPTYRIAPFLPLFRQLPTTKATNTALLKAAAFLLPKRIAPHYALERLQHVATMPVAKAHVRLRSYWPQPHKILAPELARSLEGYSPYDSLSSLTSDVPADDLLNALFYIDMRTWLADDVLVKVDRMSMAHGIEVRCPFLDVELVEFLAALPSAQKTSLFAGKMLLRKALVGMVPVGLWAQRKQGFTPPLHQWFGSSFMQQTQQSSLAPSFLPPLFNASFEHSVMSNNTSNHMIDLDPMGLRRYAGLTLAAWMAWLTAQRISVRWP